MILKWEGETYVIPGRNGDLIEDEGAYQDIVIEIQFNFIEWDDFNNKVRCVKQWLNNITDYKLRFEEDYNYFYKVKYVIVDNIERELEGLGSFKIKFVCDPFQYLLHGLSKSTFISPSTVYSGYEESLNSQQLTRQFF